MTRKRVDGVLAAVLMLIALPGVLVVAEVVTFRVHNRNNGSMISSGVRREYLLYVPPGLDRSRPVPLVISMHGAGGWPVQQMETSEWNELAVKERFLVVYPAGHTEVGPRVWDGGDEDVRFIAELIDELAGTYNIDRDRVYANGLSNGGGMSFVLSCRLSDRIAAVGLVGAALLMPWDGCEEQDAVPMIAFHGTDDRLATYQGGSSPVFFPSRFPSVPKFVERYARRNGCAPQPVETSVASDVVRRSYPSCENGADVVFYTILDGGHTWPGGKPLPEWGAGRTTQSIDADRLMWEFFLAHPKRAATAKKDGAAAALGRRPREKENPAAEGGRRSIKSLVISSQSQRLVAPRSHRTQPP